MAHLHNIHNNKVLGLTFVWCSDWRSLASLSLPLCPWHLWKRLSLLFVQSPKLILAEIPPPDWVQDSIMIKQRYYIMPSLLPTLSEAEVERYRVSFFPATFTLLVRFPSHSRCAGVFCCFVIHLIRCSSLKLMDREPIFCNYAKLELLAHLVPSQTVIDANSNIEVHACITAPVPLGKYACLFLVSGIYYISTRQPPPPQTPGYEAKDS